VLATLGASACRIEASILDAPAQDARSAILAVVGASDDIQIHAIDLPTPDDLRVPDPDGAARDLYLFGYACALDALALTEGRVPPGGARPIPPPRFARQRQGDGTWIAATAPLAAVATAKLPGEAPSDCTPLDVDTETIPGTSEESASAVAAIGEDLLVATNIGRAFLVTGGARMTIAPVDLSTTTPQIAYFLRDDGDLLAITPDGKTLHGSVESGLVEGPPLVSRDPIDDAWIDGVGDSLFVFTAAGSLEKLVDGAWRRLDGMDLGRIRRGGVAWLGPDEAVATGLGDGTYLHYSSGRVRRLSAELTPADDFEAVARLPSIGVVAGTHQGFILKWNGGGWDRIQTQPVSPQLRVITELDGQMVFGGSGGGLWRKVVASGELCGPMTFAASGVQYLKAFRGGFYGISRDRGGNQPIAVTRALRQPGDGCGP